LDHFTLRGTFRSCNPTPAVASNIPHTDLFQANPKGTAPPKSFIATAAALGRTKKTVYRELYTSAKGDEINKKLLFKEGAATTSMKDSDAKNVYQYFGDTYQFYSEVRY
jgi:hypothetical protein